MIAAVAKGFAVKEGRLKGAMSSGIAALVGRARVT